MDGGWIAAGGGHHFIDNRWVRARSGQTIDVIDPSDGKAFAKIARGNAADIDAAVQAARAARSSSTARAAVSSTSRRPRACGRGLGSSGTTAARARSS